MPISARLDEETEELLFKTAAALNTTRTSTQLNELGLPIKEFYTTRDVCEVLDLHPDTFRYRLRKGIYPEPKNMAGDKRRFTLDEIKEIIKITEEFPKPKWRLRS